MRTRLLTLTFAAAILAFSARSLPIDSIEPPYEKAAVSSLSEHNNKEAGTIKSPASNSGNGSGDADAAASSDTTSPATTTQPGAQSLDFATIVSLINMLPDTPNILIPVQDAIVVVQDVLDQVIAAVQRSGVLTATPSFDPVLVLKAVWTLLTSEPGAATGGRQPGGEPERPSSNDAASVSRAFLNNIKAGYGGPEAANGEPGTILSLFHTAVVGN